MRIDEEKFWRVTLRQFYALMKRHSFRQQREQLLVGLLASVTANYSMNGPKEPLCAADFVPGLKRPKTPELSDEEIAEQINAVFMPMAITAPAA